MEPRFRKLLFDLVLQVPEIGFDRLPYLILLASFLDAFGFDEWFGTGSEIDTLHLGSQTNLGVVVASSVAEFPGHVSDDCGVWSVECQALYII